MTLVYLNYLNLQVTANDCREIVSACNDNDISLTVCHTLRYTSWVRKIKEVIDSGIIGDVVNIQHTEPVRGYTRERDVAQSIACPPLKRSVVGSILLSGPSCSLGYFPFQPVVHNWFIKGRGMYCSVYGKMHIKDPLLLIEKSSLCGSSGFPSKKCVNVTI